jgi:hypothetical protein
VRQQLAETYQPYLFDCTPTRHQLTDTRAEYVAQPVNEQSKRAGHAKPPVENPNIFYTESEEVRAVLREQEQRDG